MTDEDRANLTEFYRNFPVPGVQSYQTKIVTDLDLFVHRLGIMDALLTQVPRVSMVLFSYLLAMLELEAHIATTAFAVLAILAMYVTGIGRRPIEKASVLALGIGLFLFADFPIVNAAYSAIMRALA